MERIYEISHRLTENLKTTHYRYLYNQIAWDDRLIMIKGSRGVGKTTMLYQQCKEKGEKGLYASLDQLFFNDHTIVELADYHYKHGGTHLYLDEVHLYPHPEWEQELKNIHDSYPGFHIVFTGSSLLQLNSRMADLSRRVAIYNLNGLSFREYLNFSGSYGFAPYTIEDVLTRHRSIASEIITKIKPIAEFEKYLRNGYYPFFMDTSELTYSQRVERIVLTVIDTDIPAVADIEYETQIKLKRLLVILAEQVPFIPNMTKLGREVGVARNQLMKFFSLLNDGAIIRTLSDGSSSTRSVVKPDKILFDNPSIMNALGITNKIGTVRESYVASMLGTVGQVSAAKDGDFVLDKQYLFEVGGRGKGFSQIEDKPNSFVLADNIETGSGNKIPLWLLGFIY